MPATHYDHIGQTACWPGRALRFTTDPLSVSCGSCRRTRTFRAALDEVIAPTWRRNGSISVRKKIARHLVADMAAADPRDMPAIALLAERLAA